MIRRTIAIGTLATLALLTSACSGKPSGSDPTPSAPPQSSGQALPYAGAPKVDSPLPASVLSGAPCTDALTATQVKEALGTPTQSKPGDTPGIGPICSWSNTETTAQIVVGYNTQTQNGLSGVYQNTQPNATVWNVLPPIQGFPAVAHVSNADGASNDFCQVSVGLADDLSIDVGAIVGLSKRGKLDPCTVASRAADASVTTLRQKAGA